MSAADDLREKQEHLARLHALSALKVPLPNPGEVYHPQHIDRKKDKESGEWVFWRAKGTVENLVNLVNAYGVRVRYNELSRDIEISVNGNVLVGELSRNTNLTRLEDLCKINGYPYEHVTKNIFSLAELDAYNPALEWIRSKPWDHQRRSEQLFECLDLADPSQYEIAGRLFRKWLLGSVAILCGKASKFEHVLVLVDENGGVGKTRFFESLCPEQWRASGVTLDVNNKDSVLQVVSKWLVELGEINATFSRSDIEALKAFLSRSSDEVRPPYARAANCYPRRTAFFGSVNNARFLVDDTNNRRFWPIEVEAVNYQHDIDMQQVWAEALHCVEHGESWHLTADENRAIGEYNDSFRAMDRVEESIRRLYDEQGTPNRWLSATEVLEEIGISQPKRPDVLKARAILRPRFDSRVWRKVTQYHMPPKLMQGSYMYPVRGGYADESPL